MVIPKLPHIPRYLIIAMAVCGVLLVVPAVAVGAMVYRYKDAYYPGVKVEGISLAGKSRAEAQQLLEAKTTQYADHAFTVTIPDISKPKTDTPGEYEEQSIQTTAKSLGLRTTDGAVLDSAWKVGHVYVFNDWIRSVTQALWSGNSQTVAEVADTQDVAAFINTEVISKIGGPTPAKVEVVDGKVVVSAAQKGFEVDEAALQARVLSAASTASDTDTTYLKAPVSLVDSPITEQSVQPLADRWTQYGAMNVSLTAGSLRYYPTDAEILSWFAPIQDDKGTLSLAVQKDAVAKYLASKTSLDQDKSMASLTDSLASLVNGNGPQKSLAVKLTAKPGKSVAPDVFEAGKFEGKYIEVNLAQQKLYTIDGTNLVKSYVVSTGKWSTPTPKGVFHINGKSPRAYSRSFGLYMPYWQNFLNGEYGLHELPEWPNGYKEGQNHLGTPVSHGCVRLGVGDAKEVYDWTVNGTPVYIH